MSIPSAIPLYLRYISISIRSQMQYRASFVMLTAGHLVVTGAEFLAILILFDRFGTLEEWNLPEVAFFYGLVNVTFAIADAASGASTHSASWSSPVTSTGFCSGQGPR